MSRFTLTPQHIEAWNRDGYLMVPGMFDTKEMDLLLKIAKADREMDKAGGPVDAGGRQSRLRLRNDLPDDIYSAIARSPRIVDTMTTLLGGEVYHWHHKMMLKEPRVGGAWEWHQDYGYWYKNNGCLYPWLASCMIAVDRAYKGNGCLKVIKGSHHIGRVEHVMSGTQVGADMERVNAALKRHELVYCEMEPGTALFFHGNLLHQSDPNPSNDPRWSLICCYNRADNDPIIEKSGHPHYSKLETWPEEKIVEYGEKMWAEIEKGKQVAGV